MDDDAHQTRVEQQKVAVLQAAQKVLNLRTVREADPLYGHNEPLIVASNTTDLAQLRAIYGIVNDVPGALKVETTDPESEAKFTLDLKPKSDGITVQVYNGHGEQKSHLTSYTARTPDIAVSVNKPLIDKELFSDNKIAPIVFNRVLSNAIRTTTAALEIPPQPL